MNLAKAIEILTKFGKGEYSCDAVTFGKAVKLGNEALKTLKDVRITFNISPLYLLPGETPEIDSKRSLHHIKQVLENNEVSQ